MGQPEHIGKILDLHPVQKRCYKCGLVWESLAFTATAPGVTLDGTCHACMDAEDEASRLRIDPLRRDLPETAVELKRPRRSPDADDDFPDSDR